MNKEKEALVEITANKTFQCMKGGQSHTVVAGKTDCIPASEAEAAENAGMLKDPSVTPECSAVDGEDLREQIDQLNDDLEQARKGFSEISVELEAVKTEAEKNTVELEEALFASKSLSSDLSKTKLDLEKATVEIKKLKAAAKKSAEKV